VVRPFDRGQGRANGLHLFTPVKRLAADEQMRDAPRLDRIDIWPSHVLAEAYESPKQDRDVARPDGRPLHLAVGLPLRYAPSVRLVDKPADERAYGIGQ